jgi:hypothetical protein
MRKAIAFLIVIFCDCSDNLKQEIKVTGVLLKYDSRLAIPNTQVFIELGKEISYVNPQTSIIDGKIHFTNSITDSTASSSLGQFSFKVDPNKHKIFRLSVAKCFVTLNSNNRIAKLLNDKLTEDSLLIGPASNLKLIVKNKKPKDGDAISIIAPCLPLDKSGLSRICSFEFDDRIGKLITTPDQKDITFQFLSDLYKEANLSVTVTKGQQTTSSVLVIPLKEKGTIEYLIEY